MLPPLVPEIVKAGSGTEVQSAWLPQCRCLSSQRWALLGGRPKATWLGTRAAVEAHSCKELETHRLKIIDWSWAWLAVIYGTNTETGGLDQSILINETVSRNKKLVVRWRVVFQ